MCFFSNQAFIPPPGEVSDLHRIVLYFILLCCILLYFCCKLYRVVLSRAVSVSCNDEQAS